MKVYVSVDMEGIAGVNHPGPTGSGHARYPAAVDLMVGETNAAIEGALAGGADDILVNDSHGGMYNLLPAALHPAARVLQGQKAWSMVEGAGPDAGFDVALFIGYHARAGHARGTIAHTYSGAPVETRLDGRPTGEYGLNAMILGAWGIPVGLVAGDDALAEEVAEWLPWAERVVVKDGGRRQRGGLGPPDRRRGPDPGRCGRRGPGARAPAISSSCGSARRSSSRSTTSRGVEADHAAIVPGAERVGDRGVRFASDDPATAYRGFLGTGVDRGGAPRRCRRRGDRA